MLFSSPTGNCSELRSQIFGILQGRATPDVMAMNLGSQPEWTRVIAQKCPVSLQVQLNLWMFSFGIIWNLTLWPLGCSCIKRPAFWLYNLVLLLFSHLFCSLSQETCESGCVLPNSLSIRVLWARQGLLDLPQNYILGAKYLFRCQNYKVGKDTVSLWGQHQNQQTYSFTSMKNGQTLSSRLFFFSVLCRPLSL